MCRSLRFYYVSVRYRLRFIKLIALIASLLSDPDLHLSKQLYVLDSSFVLIIPASFALSSASNSSYIDDFFEARDPRNLRTAMACGDGS